jgi:predicted outer membrane protein
VQATEDRLGSILRRPLSRPREIASLLFEVEAVAERTARIGITRGSHTEVVNLARRSLAELGAVRDSLDRNCTKEHSESVPFERVAERGQDIVLNLRASEDAQFDRSYLYAVMALHTELAELLDTQVAPRNAQREAEELSRLRNTLLLQEQRVQDLLDELE